MTTTQKIERSILRKQISSRGGGIEISLDLFGFHGEKMTAYQNYLGGGMLGRILSDNTLIKKKPSIDKKTEDRLDQISEDLKRYFHGLTNPDGEWESSTYEENQKRMASAY